MSMLRQCFWYFVITLTLFLGLSLYGFYNDLSYTGVVGGYIASHLHDLFGYFSVSFFLILFCLVCLGFVPATVVVKPREYVLVSSMFFMFFSSLNIVFSKAILSVMPSAPIGVVSGYLIHLLDYCFGNIGSYLFSLFVLSVSVLSISNVIGCKYSWVRRGFSLIYNSFVMVVKLAERLVGLFLKKKPIKKIKNKEEVLVEFAPKPVSPSFKVGGVDSPLSSTALIDLLDSNENSIMSYSAEEVERIKANVTEALQDFGVVGQATDVFKGPFVTIVHIELAKGGRLSSVTNLVNDLCRALGVPSLRIVGSVGGLGKIGIELPNMKRDGIFLKPLFSNSSYVHSKGLPIALGVDTSGNPFVFDLEKMPHMLVAGSTGSGKSVCLDVFIMSLIGKYDASELRLVLIDPKMTEFAAYAALPHLLVDVISDMKRANTAFDWLISEMDVRYKVLLDAGVRNINDYNQIDGLEKIPRIVVVVDEFADLILVVGKSIESSVQRIAQKARACGIHLVIATQRPSADVITGLIKSNIPGRVSLKVSSAINSRTILEQSGAEQLTSVGDMLVSLNSSVLTRVHCAYVSPKEIERVVSMLSTYDSPDKVDLDAAPDKESAVGVAEADLDLYKEVVEYLEHGKTYSISGIQRRFRIGYNRSARLFEQLEADGLIKAGASGKKQAFISNE
ncbi:DNA translocase FtsK [Pseudoalteromonas marina]|uniref:DNA translocase FtsK n=2 Tax=Bacteria TaxID=2 RepID=A0ABT9FCB3_9GAMM|nr:DNA translocase FtsK [Pseudoalteromonas marina]MDP2564314.1 DNA translocase FtsK [Pseudoalteromonas marina]